MDGDLVVEVDGVWICQDCGHEHEVEVDGCERCYSEYGYEI